MGVRCKKSHQEHPYTWRTFLIILIILMDIRMLGMFLQNKPVKAALERVVEYDATLLEGLCGRAWSHGSMLCALWAVRVKQLFQQVLPGTKQTTVFLRATWLLERLVNPGIFFPPIPSLVDWQTGRVLGCQILVCWLMGC